MKWCRGHRRRPFLVEREGRSDVTASEWFVAPPDEAIECAHDGCLISSENAQRPKWRAHPAASTGARAVKASLFGNTLRSRDWSLIATGPGALSPPLLVRHVVGAAISQTVARTGMVTIGVTVEVLPVQQAMN